MRILPIPKHISIKKQKFTINLDTRMIVSQECNIEDLFAADLLNQEIFEVAGYKLPIIKGFQNTEKNVISIHRTNLNEQAYEICVEAGGITLSGKSETGIFYAVQTLRQIIRQEGVNLTHLTIKDQPDFSVRGFYYDVTRGKVPKMKTLMEIADKAAYYKLNQLQLYVEHTFAFRNMKEVWSKVDPLTHEDIIWFDEYCKKLHIELVPSLACFGHLYHLLNCKKYTHLCELDIDENRPFSWVDRMAHHTIDVSNPESMEVIIEMLDEFIPLFSSDKFNICCDETFDLGEGKNKEVAMKVGKSRLYLDFLKKIIAHVEKRGKKVMFWGDIVLSHPECLSELSNNVICLNWWYEEDIKRDDIAKVAEAKMQQYVCPGVSAWNRIAANMDKSFVNIRRMVSCGKEFGAEGVLNTDWGDYGHVNLFSASIPGMIYGAALSWNCDMDWSDAQADVDISFIEYGDKSGKLTGLLRELGRTQIINWGQLVCWYDKKFKNLVHEYNEQNRFDVLKDCSQDEINSCFYKALSLERKIMDLLPTITENSKLLANEYCLSARGISIMNSLLLVIKKFDFRQDNIKLIHTIPELSKLLKLWLKDYCAAWRFKNKESELGRIEDMINEICVWLKSIEQDYSSVIMLMMDTNYVIDHGKIVSAIQDIHDKGFEGVCLEFRNSIYNEQDVEGKLALEIAVEEANRLGLGAIRTFPFPGINILKKFPQARQKWVVEARGEVVNNKVEIRLPAPDRCDLTQTKPSFLEIIKVYQVTRQDDVIIHINDISGSIHYNVDMDALPLFRANWNKYGEILVYAVYSTDSADYAFEGINSSVDELLENEKGFIYDGYALDEFRTGTSRPGFYLVGEHFLNEFQKNYGYKLLDKLYMLQNEVVGECAGKVRYDYYEFTIELTYRIQKYLKNRFQSLYGSKSFIGFHHTWWGEGNSGDLWGGCIDYFKLADTLSGGFVDAQYNTERTMASLTILAESLAKYSDSGIAYNMCWDVYPTHEKMDYYHRLLAVRNVRWVGHGYGKTGPFGPGYPDHSTWGDATKCVYREKVFQEFIGSMMSKPKVAMLYLWESLACMNDEFIHYHRLGMKGLLHKFMLNHIEIDVLPSFDMDYDRYETLIVPWPLMMPQKVWEALKNYAQNGGRIIFTGPPAQYTTEGLLIDEDFADLLGMEKMTSTPYLMYTEEFEYEELDIWFTDKKLSMRCYPMKPKSCETVIKKDGKIFGVKNAKIEYYSFEIALTSHFEDILLSLKGAVELDLPDNVISKTSYEGDVAVITITSRWNEMFNVNFNYKTNIIEISEGRLVGIRLEGNTVVDIISEPGASITINSRTYDYRLMKG